MDEPVDGPPRPPPDAAEIRRALAECMTLGDIDDAMGWATGTARHRRWQDADAGGLPPADAELGGVPLWFRATISRWRAQEHAPPTVRHAEPEPPVAETEIEVEPEEADDDVDDEPEPDSGAETGPVEDDEPGSRGVGTGFALTPGQEVLALIRGAWHPAVVVSRDRRTVVVDYQLAPGLLGARRQRVTLERIRLPSA